MKLIELTHGIKAQISDRDAKLVNKFKWCAVKRGKTFYAEARKGCKMISMHRLILGLNDPKIKGDHRDRNGLNNQRNNLRVATNSQSSANRGKHINGKSKYFGVSWFKHAGLWRSQIQKNGIVYHLGYFKDEKKAAIAYNKAAEKFHGEFANINSI